MRQVIVATELQTTSAVITPTVLHTLPLHITLVQHSTRGSDGLFSLDSVKTGATETLTKPIATATLDPSANLLQNLPQNFLQSSQQQKQPDLSQFLNQQKQPDLSQFLNQQNKPDLSQFGLGGLSNGFGGSSDIMSALTALLQQQNNNGNSEPPRQQQQQQRPKSNVRQSKFHQLRTENEPELNVIKGFTLKDQEERRRPAPQSKKRPAFGGGGGTAAQNTRFSKYHKKAAPENNAIRPRNNAITPKRTFNRESERFSASNQQRTFPKTSFPKPNRRPAPHRRTGRKAPTITFRQGQRGNVQGKNINRNNGRRSNRKFGKSFDSLNAPEQFLAKVTSRGRVEEVSRASESDNSPVHTTVLTMFVTGTAPGDFSKTYQTVTLRSFNTNTRVRREVSDNRVTNANTFTQFNATRPAVSKPATNSQFKLLAGSKISQVEILNYLKKQDKKTVESLLHSLQKWILYYSDEILDENIDNSPVLSSSMKLSTGVQNSKPSCSGAVVTKTVVKTIYLKGS